MVGLRRTDTWSALSGLLLVSCGSCGRRFPAAQATVPVEEGGVESRPGYLLLPVQGTPSVTDLEQGQRFLGKYQLPPSMIADLVPSGWPASGAGPDSGVLSTFEAGSLFLGRICSLRAVMTDALTRQRIGSL
jgi:hypothetical protein